MAKWKGPGLITQMHGDVTAKIQLGAHKYTTVHTDMLKPCTSRHYLPVDLESPEDAQPPTQDEGIQVDSPKEAPDIPATTTTTSPCPERKRP